MPRRARPRMCAPPISNPSTPRLRAAYRSNSPAALGAPWRGGRSRSAMSITGIWARRRESPEQLAAEMARAFWPIAGGASKVIRGRLICPARGERHGTVGDDSWSRVVFWGPHPHYAAGGARARDRRVGRGRLQARICAGVDHRSCADRVGLWALPRERDDRRLGKVGIAGFPQAAEAFDGRADAARHHHGGGGLHPRPDLPRAEASDALGRETVGGGASARQRRSRLDPPVRFVPGLGGVRSDIAEAPR